MAHKFLQYPLGMFRNPNYDNGRCWHVVNHTYCGFPVDAECHENQTDKRKVVIHAACEITISNPDPVEAQAVAEILFRDDITSKSEMFSVRIERMEVEPLSAPSPMEASTVIACCGLCGWYNSFLSLSEAPESCPTCSSNLVTQNQPDHISSSSKLPSA